jgi:hypothetical protein
MTTSPEGQNKSSYLSCFSKIRRMNDVMESADRLAALLEE